MSILKKFIILVFFINLGCNSAFAQQNNDNPQEVVIYYTLSTPPNNHDGSLSYTEQLKNSITAALKNENLYPTFKPTPWVRLMRQAQNENNALIFQMIRTDDREYKFHWITPLNTKENLTYLYTRNEEKLVNLTKQEITNGSYHAVCRRQAAQCKMLLNLGFKPENLSIVTETKPGMLETFLLRKRVDFFATSKNILENNLSLLKGQGEIDFLNHKKPSLVQVMKLTDKLDYLAAPNSIEPQLLIKIKAALKEFKLPQMDQ